MTTRGEQSRSIVVLVAAAALFLAIARPLFQGTVYTADDLGHFHLPMRAFYAGCLANGTSFTWFPGMYCGFDLHGEGQVGLFHPWHLLIYRLLPLATAFNLELFACYPAIFAGTFVFLRRWQLPRDASLLGAMVFSLAGFNLYHYKHINMVAVIAHLPWLLVAMDVALRSTEAKRVAWARFAIAIMTASQLLLGHPQSLWLGGVVEAAYACWLWRRDRVAWQRLAGWAVAKLLGGLAGAVQLLPTYDALRQSYRAKPTRAFLGYGSLVPANLVQWLAPFLYRARVIAPALPVPGSDETIPAAVELSDFRAHEFGLYAGAIVPVLLIWLGLRRRELGAYRPLARVALWFGLVTIVLACGKYGPGLDAVMLLPVANLFRVPARYILLVHLSIAVLMAIAFADLAELAGRGEQIPWRRLWPLAVLPLASMAVSVSVPLLARRWPETFLRAGLSPLRWTALGPILVLAATMLVILIARGVRPALISLIVFAAADEALYALTYLRAAPVLRVGDYIATKPKAPAGNAPRVRLIEPCWDAGQTLQHVRLVGGYSGFVPLRRLDYARPANQRMAGVQWVETREGTVSGWQAVTDPMPRARLVSHVISALDPNQVVDTIDLTTTAIADAAPSWPPNESGRAELLADRPGEIVVRTRAPARQLLVLTESFHNGWKATLDGRRWPLQRINGDFLGCVVEPGSHLVSLRFSPRSLAVGKVVSLAGLASALGWLVVSLVKAGSSQGGPGLTLRSARRTLSLQPSLSFGSIAPGKGSSSMQTVAD